MAVLCLTFFTSMALADISPLPVDLTPGHVPSEEGFSQDGDTEIYEDESIRVEMQRVEFHDATFNVARVRIADPSQLRTALSAKYSKNMRHDRISTMAKNNHAVVAIGGDYFHNEEGGYVIRQGEVLRKKAKGKDVLLIDRDGNFRILIKPSTDEIKEIVESEEGLIVNSFNFGPALVMDGEKMEMPSKYAYNLSSSGEPRCAIGQLGELEYLLVVVDGRRKDSAGCTGDTLAQFMYDQGCIQAYNLDGGNSALMTFHGENYSDKTVEGERGVSDIIYFATAVDFGLDP